MRIEGHWATDDRLTDRSLHLGRLVLFAGVLAAALLALRYVDRPRVQNNSARLAAADCVAWDEEAVSGISGLLADTSAAAELKLNEALSQLHRARVYCRSGALDVAAHDYVSLHRAFPTATGSVRVAPHTRSEPATKVSLPE